jgi:hypothetical protein
MPDFRGLVPALLIAGALAGILGSIIIYFAASFIGAHITISWS